MKKFRPFIQRDLGWLSFNYRVLLESQDPLLPLYERIKFLGSSNLDEFFRVQVASLQSLKEIRKKAQKLFYWGLSYS